MGARTTFTRGPATMLQRVAPGRGGGEMYATPPSGQRTISSAFPPTCLQAKAWPNSWTSTMAKSVRYSRTFQTKEEYSLERKLIEIKATMPQDQSTKTWMPMRRKRRNEPRLV